MKSQLRQLYERYQAAGFPSRLQIKLDMEARLAEEENKAADIPLQKITESKEYWEIIGKLIEYLTENDGLPVSISTVKAIVGYASYPVAKPSATENCPTCGGTGYEPGFGKAIYCPNCKGKGYKYRL